MKAQPMKINDELIPDLKPHQKTWTPAQVAKMHAEIEFCKAEALRFLEAAREYERTDPQRCAPQSPVWFTPGDLQAHALLTEASVALYNVSQQDAASVIAKIIAKNPDSPQIPYLQGLLAFAVELKNRVDADEAFNKEAEQYKWRSLSGRNGNTPVGGK
jgi:hypothetical protein